MNKLVLLIIAGLLYALILVTWQEDYKVKGAEDISFTEAERNRTIFYHKYHGILYSYENEGGVWVFERNGKECKVETEAAKKSYRRRI